MRKQLLIIGGSYAAVEAASSARDSGYVDDILIVSAERELPYHRPPLSKAFLKAEEASGELLKGPKFYTSRAIELELGVSALNMSSGNTVQFSNGMDIRFDSLMLAVGARPRNLTCEGADFKNVFRLKSVEDAHALKEAAKDASDVVVIGGGFIGLEVASTFIQQEKSVTVVEATERVLARVASPEISSFIAGTHTNHGVKLVFGVGVERISGEQDRAREVILTDGRSLKADLILVGIGSVANLKLARQLGLETANGISVDHRSQTSRADIYAAGDCAFYTSPVNPLGIRLESVQNANDQARVAGANMAGVEKSYDALPWFWSDQYACKLQMAGLSSGATERHVVDSPEGVSVFHFRNDICVCIESINKPREHMAARRLLPRAINRRQLQEFEFNASALLKSTSD